MEDFLGCTFFGERTPMKGIDFTSQQDLFCYRVVVLPATLLG